MADIQDDGDVTGGVEHAAGAGGVADGLVDAVFAGDFFFRLGAAHPDGHEDVVRSARATRRSVVDSILVLKPCCCTSFEHRR